MVQIRPAEAGDVEALTAILNETIADGDALVYERQRTVDQVRAYAEENVTVHVAERDGVVIGGYTLRPNQPGRGAHVCNATYVVARSARGLGVGRAMGEHSLAEARSLGFTAMQFNAVVATNAAAVRLWQQLGFAIVGTVPGAFRRGDGTFVDLLVMHRML
jgi:L-amino acid N-acyltransferase YncA